MKPPPHNLDAEKAILGSIILNPNSIRDIRTILDPSDFFIEKSKLVYEAMLKIVGPIDIVTISEQLRLGDNLDKTGGIAALSELVSDVATSENIEYYARIVADTATRRRIINAGMQISHIANKDLDLSEIKAESTSSLKQAIVNDSSSGLSVNAFDYIDTATSEAINREPIQGVVRTRMGRLDSEYGGLYPGIPYLLAGRTSMGKSVTALCIIISACLLGMRVMLFSFEESKRIIMWRLLSNLAQVPLARIFKRNLAESERREIEQAAKIIKTFNLTIIDRSISSQQISDICEMENERKKVDLVVVDLISKVKEDPKLFGYSKVTLTSNTISKLPVLIDAPVLALHQINRKVEDNDKDKMPKLNHLRDSGTLEEDFKTILLLLRPYYYDKTKDPHEMAMNVAKNANGPVGNLKLWCDLPVMTIKAATDEEGY